MSIIKYMEQNRRTTNGASNEHRRRRLFLVLLLMSLKQLRYRLPHFTRALPLQNFTVSYNAFFTVYLHTTQNMWKIENDFLD